MFHSTPRRGATLLVFAVLALAACGEFSNDRLQPDTWTICSSLVVEVEPPVLPPATLGEPWAGWLHGQALMDGDPTEASWTVDALPKGLYLDEQRGLLWGRPEQAGTITIEASLAVAGCEEAVRTTHATLQVAPACAGAECQDATCSDLSLYDPSVTVEVVSETGVVRPIERGETLAVDAAVVVSNELQHAGPGPDRQLVLDVPESKDLILIHYTLPGGIRVPLDDRTIDLRYIRGDYDDHYLFLSRGHLMQLVLYDGFLSTEEIARRCPGETPRCTLPEFRLIPTACEAQDGRQPMAMETVTGEGPDAGLSRLAIGDTSGSGGLVINVLDAWQCGGDASCREGYTPLHRLSFLQVPTRPPLCSIGVAPPDPLLADAKLTFEARLHHAGTTAPITFDWPVEGPEDASLMVKQITNGELALHMPLVGEYTVRLNCSSDDDTAFGTAEVKLVVERRAPYRVEMWWRSAAGSPAPTEPPQLTVGGIEASKVTGRVQAMDLDLQGKEQTVEVTYVPSEGPSPPVQLWVRVTGPGGTEVYAAGTLQPTQAKEIVKLNPFSDEVSP